MAGANEDGWKDILNASVLDRIYPPSLYPRQWFPELESIARDLFRRIWQADAALRERLSGAAADAAADEISALLGLPALLSRHPQALVMMYRQMISGFIRRLHRRPEERQDITQEVFSRLLSGKLTQIRSRFNSSFGPAPSFTSYFMVCVRNMYIDIVREGVNLPMKRCDLPLAVLEGGIPSPLQSSSSAFMDEELAKLRAILRLHPSSRDRITLSLKLKCRLSVSEGDIRRCFPTCSASDILELRADFRRRRDRDVFRALAAVFNRHEARPVQADTLRKWVDSRARLVIAHMNRLHGRYVYNGDNIGDLLSLFFAEEDADAAE